MTTPSIGRRGFLAGGTLVAAAGTLPFTVPGAMPTAMAAPQDGLEEELASLDKPIYLLETFVPDSFSTDAGSSLEISGAHGKVGSHSLQWDHGPGARLRIEGDIGYIPRSGGNMDHFSAWVYNETPTDDHLRFEFGRGAEVDAHLDFQLDFTGWRTFWLRYDKDVQGEAQAGLDRISLLAPASAGTLWIDQVVTNMTMRGDLGHSDMQVPETYPELESSSNFHWMGVLEFWQQRTDPGFDSSDVSEAEIEDAKLVYDRLLERQREDRDYDTAALDAYEGRLDGYDIPELADPDAKGAALQPARPGAFILDKQLEIIPGAYRGAVHEFANAVKLRKVWDETGQPLVQAYDTARRAGDDGAAERAGGLILRILAHLDDQGWATGSGQGSLHHVGYEFRSWVKSLLMMEPLLRERELWGQVGSTLEWIAGTGRLLNDFTRKRDRSGMADVMNTYTEGLLSTCFAPGSWEERVGRLRAFKSWNDHVFSYAHGTNGGFKPDGSLYHHVGPYPLYGRDGLAGTTPVATDVAGTAFGLDPSSQEVLTQGLHHQLILANVRDYPLSQTGRQQTGTHGIAGLIDPFARTGLTRLDGAPGYDEEQAALFLYLLPPDPADWSAFQAEARQLFLDAGIEEASPPNGYWALPYASTGLRREGSWSVTMRTHNRYIWATEIYWNNNSFGRYQTYGQITVFADTDDEDDVTMLENGVTQPGYDWRFIPGATTKTIPFEQLKQPLSGRTTSLALTDSRFGGSGALQDTAVVVGMELREHPYYDYSHTARISALMVGDRVIALGSGINNDDGDNPTRTTLYQASPELMSNPQEVRSGKNWVTDPTGNGYVLLEGPDITHTLAEQTTPDQTSTKEGTLLMALGYLDHGTSPDDAGYAYTMLVQGGAEATGALAQAMSGDDAPVSILQRDRIAHVVTDAASQVTAHVVFEPETALADGSVVRSIDRQAMVLTHPSGDGRSTEFSVTDPDLHLYEGRDETAYDEDGTYLGNQNPYEMPWRYQESLKTETTVVLEGRWRVRHPREARELGLTLKRLSSGDTAVTLSTQHGKSVEFSLIQTANPPGNDG
ncbi:hypothetical protein CFK38_04965 [Brachybacterium vulturis]|uniref:Uncharacterized protein n=1 Tax=Brachybacterium vulturis TaxID=2017484 RepID=A0A291GLW1_9MICO|nr:chondroitinase family polysaccharide lyase [Brachybacterium vulturis]ATG50954.1 hypothetical protein CFK38_04965 [Brachybacterium vulturis]